MLYIKVLKCVSCMSKVFNFMLHAYDVNIFIVYFISCYVTDECAGHMDCEATFFLSLPGPCSNVLPIIHYPLF